jgi:hypothetical protein
LCVCVCVCVCICVCGTVEAWTLIYQTYIEVLILQLVLLPLLESPRERALKE